MPANNKKDYQDTIAVLMTRATPETLINKATKIFVSTEDQKLKKAIGVVISNLKQAALARTKKSAVGHLDINSPPYSKIVEYCNACLSSIKPQWQIIAEQNGWAPK